MDAPARGKICAVILAAGRSTRFGDSTKLVAPLDGVAIVRRAALAALASRARPVLVVTGHEGAKVEGALDGLPLLFASAPAGEGLSASLRAGLAAVPPDAAGAVILLGDMPLVPAGLIDALIEAFAQSGAATGAAPVRAGRRGNPALIGRALFSQVAALRGDEGARAILDREGERIVTVEAPDDGALIDVDTAEQLECAQRLGDQARRRTP